MPNDKQKQVSVNVAVDTGPDAAVEAPADPLAALQAEVDQLKKDNLKLIAEQRNMQARAARELEQTRKYAEAAFAKDLLNTVDGLEKALDAAGPDNGPLAAGMRLVHADFLKLLRSRGIEPIAALGQPFNPELHEALAQQPSPDQPAGTVLTEVNRGYKMHERVLRCARVIVSSGPAK